MNVTLTLTEQQLEQIAERVAVLLAERLPATPDENMLDVGGAAAFLACKKNRIYALVSAGRIPHYKDGSRTLFDRAELRDYVRAGGARRP